MYRYLLLQQEKIQRKKSIFYLFRTEVRVIHFRAKDEGYLHTGTITSNRPSLMSKKLMTLEFKIDEYEHKRREKRHWHNWTFQQGNKHKDFYGIVHME